MTPVTASSGCSRISPSASPQTSPCDNLVTTTQFLPQLEAQLADVRALRNDAQAAASTPRSLATPATRPTSRATSSA
jgi:hypothetical protein